jgi:hypothetical protein
MSNFTKVEISCAASIIIFFFLPWAQFMGLSASGYNLGDFGSYANLVWLIPGSSVLLIILAVNGKDLKIVGILTGVLPFLGLLYGFSEVGGDLFQILGIGAYLTLISALILVLTLLGIIKTSANPAETGTPLLWGDIAKSMKTGVDTIVGKTEALSKIGKLKIDILNTNRNIEKQFAHLGGQVYQIFSEDDKVEIAKNSKIKEIFNEIRTLQESLQSKNRELEKVQIADATTKKPSDD